MRTFFVLAASLAAGPALAVCPSADFTLSGTGAGLLTGDTTGARPSFTPSCSFGGSTWQQVEYVAGVEGDYTFSLAGSSFDTVLRAVSADDCVSELTCNDDAAGSTQSQITVTLAAGEAVFLEIGGFGPWSAGAWTLGVTWAPPSPPPVCGPDFDLGSAVGPAVAIGDTTGAGNDMDGASCSLGQQAPDHTYLWTAPTTDTYTFYTTGSGYDTAMTVRDLTCGELACDDDTGPGESSAITLSATAGEQFYIVIDGFAPPVFGAYQLGIQQGAACADGDGDSVCDWADECIGDDASWDSDVDGICDDQDFSQALSTGFMARGSTVTLTTVRAPPGAQVVFLASTATSGAGACHPSGLVCLELLGPVRRLGTATASAAGEASISFTVPPSAQPGMLVTFQSVWFLGGQADKSDRDYGFVQ